MKYWTMAAAGRANLELAESPVPAPGPGQILVQVAAAALNYRDRLAIDHGLTMVFPETGPFVPGSDMAGVVVDIGTGGSGRATGRSPPACRIAEAIQRTQHD